MTKSKKFLEDAYDAPDEDFEELSVDKSTNPSKESLLLAKDLLGDAAKSFDKKYSKNLKELANFGIAAEVDEGWVRGHRWRSYMRDTK